MKSPITFNDLIDEARKAGADAAREMICDSPADKWEDEARDVAASAYRTGEEREAFVKGARAIFEAEIVEGAKPESRDDAARRADRLARNAEGMLDTLKAARSMIDVSLIRTSQKAMERWTALAHQIDAVVAKAEGR